MARPRNRDEFRIAIICALPSEAEMVQLLFDKDWADDDLDLGQAEGDQNVYSLGTIGKHNVVLAFMPAIGNTSAAGVAAGLRSSYTRIEVAFVTGICGVAPIHPDTQKEILLGDCIISTTLVQYDFGRQYPGSFIRKTEPEDTLGRASPNIRSLVASLQTGPNLKRLSLKLTKHMEILQKQTPLARYPGASKDRLYEDSYLHKHHEEVGSCDRCLHEANVCRKNCEELGCDNTRLVKRSRLADDSTTSRPQLHFGKYGSSNSVLRSGEHRQQLASDEGIAAFEMEGAGIWENLPTILVKSACDYADSHKSKGWQSYAAATAASAVKSILETMSKTESKQTESTLQVAFNVPNFAVTTFVHRKSLLRELDDWMEDKISCERLVLLGMGGAGKSQLALECLKRAESKFTTIFWVNASSELAVQQSLKLIILGMHGTHSESSDWKDDLRLLSTMLCSRGGRWLAVFDNFDTPATFKHDLIANYVPTVGQGKVLLTSRDGSCTRLGHVLPVSGMTEQESLELLLKESIHDPKKRGIGRQICAELGHLALALDQAEAYIRARNLQLEDFIKHFADRKALVLKEIPLQWEYRRVEVGTNKSTLLSAFITWELSFSQVSGSRRIKRYKKHFLTLCAYFDPASIKKEYFTAHFKTARKGWMYLFKKGNKFDGYLFDDLIAEFRRLSLLQNDGGHDQGANLSIHTLVREWLKLRGTTEQQREMAEELTDLLVDHIEGSDFVRMPYVDKQRLYTNITSCMREDRRFEDTSSNFPTYAAAKFAWVQQVCGLYDEAQQLFHKALEAHKKTPSLNAFELGRTHRLLGNAYTERCMYLGAEVEYLCALALDDSSWNRLHTMQSLAQLYKSTNRLDEAEELSKKILVHRRMLSNQMSTHFFPAMSVLAEIHTRKGEYKKAEIQYKRLLRDQEILHGHTHPDTIGTMYNLALLYRNMGDIDQSMKLLEQAVPRYEKAVGPRHPSSILAAASLGILYHSKQKYLEAEAMLEGSLEGLMKTQNFLNRDVLEVMYYLGIVYQDLGKFDQAEEFLFKILVYSYGTKLGISYSSSIPPRLTSIREKRGMSGRWKALIREKDLTSRCVLNVTIWFNGEKQSPFGYTEESDSSLSYSCIVVTSKLIYDCGAEFVHLGSGSFEDDEQRSHKESWLRS